MGKNAAIKIHAGFIIRLTLIPNFLHNANLETAAGINNHADSPIHQNMGKTSKHLTVQNIKKLQEG